MPKTIKYPAYGEIHPLSLKVTYYMDNNQLAIVADTYSNNYAEPWGTLTVNITDKPCDKNCAFIDVNTNPNLLEWLIENKLATPTGKTLKSGFVTYPEVKFNMETLKEFDPEGCAEYNQLYREVN